MRNTVMHGGGSTDQFEKIDGQQATQPVSGSYRKKARLAFVAERIRAPWTEGKND
jgi:hypothetical protein